ncbi:unnamed protein product [Rodentolepis nana]|uniref:Aldedh domain-containing protein n=1 Tax=Rodentolepis nana TaxID=102285 RepID=A0A0R3TPM0_RODNA|nr:unnamed protein product [Rodentolepis nana]
MSEGKYSKAHLFLVTNAQDFVGTSIFTRMLYPATLIPIFLQFSSEDEAVALANSTPMGLAGYMFSREVGQCWRVAESLECGLVGVNTGMVSTPEAPFGGIKQSGIGHEGGPGALKEFMNLRIFYFQDFALDVISKVSSIPYRLQREALAEKNDLKLVKSI